MRRIGELVLHHRKLIIIGWLVIFVFGAFSAGHVVKRLKVDFSLPGEPGTKTAKQIESQFGNGGFTTPFLLQVTVPAGQKVRDHEAEIQKAFEAAAVSEPNLRLVDRSRATSGTSTDVFYAGDRTEFALLNYPFVHGGSAAFKSQVPKIRDAITAAVPSGWAAGVTGEDALQSGNSDSSGTGVLAEALLGGLGALLVLAYVFASFLAFLPIVIAIASILLSFLMLWPLTHATDVSFIVQYLLALIGLGVAIDYSLLLVNRWREERDHGRDNHDAVIEAMTHAGKAVVFSGVTVAIGLLALVLLPVPFLRSVGIGGALIPLASVLTTLTLAPAILGGIGPKVDWPKIRHENVASRGWTSWARGVVKNRFAAAGLGLLALGLLFASFLGIKIGLAGSESLATKGPTYASLQQLRAGGLSTGVLTPLQVLTSVESAPEVASTLSRVDGIDKVIVSTQPGNVRNGETVVFALPDKETVNNRTIQPVKEAKAAVLGMPGVVGVAGVGADQIDFLNAVYGNAPYMIVFIALLTFVLLARGFRSVVLPIKAVLLNLLTLAATLGFMVAFWQFGHGSNAVFGIASTGAVTFWVPLMVFAFLFGLSMDYEVFILSRMREEYDELGSTDAAVVEGIARTGRLVTSAALILFLAFVALASGPGTDLKVLASALGFGILLDATIVRSLLVPALVSLFGDWNWWMPSWLAKILRVPPGEPHRGPHREAPVAVAD
jgi:RND superfamily putative drug exporter